MTPVVLLPLLLAAGPFDDSLKTVPPSANVIVLLDVKAALASPIAQSEDWSGKVKDKYKAGVGLMPPGAERVVIAGQVGLSARQWDWMASTIDAPDAPDVTTLVRREKGQLSTVADRPVVLSPRGAYFTTLNPNRLVAFYPTNRQALARWIRHAKVATGPDSLADVTALSAENQVVIALDLRDALDPNAIKGAMPSMVSLAKTKYNQETFSRALATMSRLTVAIKLGSTISATVKLDFGGSLAEYRPVLQALFVEMLEGEGVALPEVATMKVAFVEKSMVLTGDLSPASFERILSLFAFPHANPEPSQNEPGDSSKPTLTATKRYYDAVSSIVADLSKLKVEKNYEKTSAWHESAARKLEQLNPHAVDPKAIEMAQGIASRLRAISGSLAGVPIDMKALDSAKYYTWQTDRNGFAAGRGWWGTGGSTTTVQTNYQQILEQQSKVTRDDAKLRSQLWGQIDESLSKTRAALTQGYPGF